MITKCEFTYMKFAPVTIHCWPSAQACRPGSKKRCRAALPVDQRARVLERDGRLAVDRAAHDPVRVVGAGEQRELAQRVEPALRQPSAAGVPSTPELREKVL